ncbi:MAG: hypothetical protein HYT80_09300 [Euryarchaeota archaeon]|nr:hypothetical protein [Euryarchaeota archaeon]
MNKPTLVAIAVSLLAALAGCMDDAGRGLQAKATLDFEGQGNGSHSETGSCKDEGDIAGEGTLHDGSVTVRVTDSGGSQLFERSFKESFDLSKEVIRGDSGSWKIEATRSGNDLAGDQFNGRYEFRLYC